MGQRNMIRNEERILHRVATQEYVSEADGAKFFLAGYFYVNFGDKNVSFAIPICTNHFSDIVIKG